MVKAKRTIRICTSPLAIVVFLCATAQVMRHLDRLGQMALPGLFVALVGAAGVFIALFCSRTEDESLYLRPGGDDLAICQRGQKSLGGG
jgi:hypothetical protein